MKQLILIGGMVHPTPLLKKQLAQIEFGKRIAADAGLNWAQVLQIKPDFILGDFDSVKPEILAYYRQQKIPMKEFPARKDYTDSELAVWAALDEAKPGDEIWIVGGIGSRMDHTLGNVSLLYAALKKGVRAYLTDGLNEITLVQGPWEGEWERRQQQKYFSLIPYLEKAEGIDLEGFAYPLQDAVLQMGQCRGISNEIVAEKGRMHLEKGYLLVIRSTEDTMDLTGR